MSNGIQKKQNEDISIARLAAQRQLYNEVGQLGTFNFIFSVLIPLFISIIQVLISSWTWTKTTACVLSIMVLFLSIEIEKIARDKKTLAASIQQAFDVYVYGMPWDKKLFGKEKNLTELVVQKSKRILDNNAECEKLKDWYRPEADGLLREKGILACQKENYNWDGGLRKRCRFVSLICLLLLTLIVFIVGLVTNEPAREWVFQFFLILPIIRWFVTLWDNLGKDIDRLNELSSAFNSNEDKSMEDLQFIQKSIFEHRKNAIKVPDMIYNIFKDNDEDRERRVVEMESQ